MQDNNQRHCPLPLTTACSGPHKLQRSSQALETGLATEHSECERLNQGEVAEWEEWEYPQNAAAGKACDRVGKGLAFRV